MGTLSMAAFYLAGLRVISYIAGKYSLRRKVADGSTGLSKPIINFSTQYIPVMTAIADAYVSVAFVRSVHTAFRDPKHGPGMRHFLATVLKVTVFGHAIKDTMALGDRCGAQGLLQVNQFCGFLVRMETPLLSKSHSDSIFHLGRFPWFGYCGRGHPRDIHQIYFRVGFGKDYTTPFRQPREPVGASRDCCHIPSQVAPPEGSGIFAERAEFS